MKGGVLILGLFACVSVASAKVFFEEKFDDSWQSRWVLSDWKKDDSTNGDWVLSAGKFYADPEDKGIQTSPDARFFAVSAKLSEPFDNTDKDLVFQFQVKHEQKIDCGGGYMKLLSGDVDQSKFSGDTEYSIMFGPDICGYSTKRIHTIFNHEGENLLMKPTVDCETDELSHVYTLIVSPNNTYKIFTDGEEKKTGSLYEDWDFLQPKKIKDPEAEKPEDWVDDAMMDDPTDVKPEGHDDIPAEIVDAEASKPEDWSDEDDGEWEAPSISNPDFKGPWKAKKIPNPAFKGKWVAPDIDNPEFKDNPAIYKRAPITHVGIELWQVKAGTIFDNVLLTDDAEYAKTFAEDTFGKLKEGEKAMYEEDKKKVEADLKESEDEMEGEGEGEEEEEEAEAEDEEYGDEEEEEDKVSKTRASNFGMLPLEARKRF